MKAKIITTSLLVVILIVIVYVFYLNKATGDKNIEQEKTEEVKKSDIDIIDVDFVAENPQKYKGSIGVSGKVVQVDESKNLFILGCEDACVYMPVKYKGKMPPENNNVIAFGEIKLLDNGKYIFEASDFKAK